MKELSVEGIAYGINFTFEPRGREPVHLVSSGIDGEYLYKRIAYKPSVKGKYALPAFEILTNLNVRKLYHRGSHCIHYNKCRCKSPDEFYLGDTERGSQIRCNNCGGVVDGYSNE